MEAAALLTSSFGQKELENADLAVLGSYCWALLLQFTENLSCNKILPEGSKSLQLLVFHIVILNCSKLSCPHESCITILPLCFHACTDRSGRCQYLCWAHPRVIYTQFQGALPTQDLCHWVQAHSGVHQQAPLPGTSWHHTNTLGSPEAAPPGISGKWGGSALPHCRSMCVPSGRTGVQLAPGLLHAGCTDLLLQSPLSWHMAKYQQDEENNKSQQLQWQYNNHNIIIGYWRLQGSGRSPFPLRETFPGELGTKRYL